MYVCLLSFCYSLDLGLFGKLLVRSVTISCTNLIACVCLILILCIQKNLDFTHGDGLRNYFFLLSLFLKIAITNVISNEQNIYKLINKPAFPNFEKKIRCGGDKDMNIKTRCLIFSLYRNRESVPVKRRSFLELLKIRSLVECDGQTDRHSSMIPRLCDTSPHGE